MHKISIESESIGYLSWSVGKVRAKNKKHSQVSLLLALLRGNVVPEDIRMLSSSNGRMFSSPRSCPLPAVELYIFRKVAIYVDLHYSTRASLVFSGFGITVTSWVRGCLVGPGSSLSPGTLLRLCCCPVSWMTSLLVPCAQTGIRQHRTFSVYGPATCNWLPVALRLTPIDCSAVFHSCHKIILFNLGLTESAPE